MHCATLQAPSIAGDLAQDLLAAWNSRDACELSAEIERTLSLSLEVNSSVELERLQLLLAIAEHLRGCDNPFALRRDSPVLELCRTLLGHLAAHTFPFGPAKPRPARRGGLQKLARVQATG